MKSRVSMNADISKRLARNDGQSGYIGADRCVRPRRFHKEKEPAYLSVEVKRW